MNYQQTIGYLYSQLPMFHRIGPPAYKANLDNTIALSEHFGQPERKFPAIHIAGTNGKGSVAHMLAAILQQQGYKTGLATSPHLRDFRERIRINGQMIPKSYVARFVTRNQQLFEDIRPSFFELTIALTFHYFAEQQPDIAVIETGLGGRLDSTNIITPEVSVITNIGLDHTHLLGDTLEKIAGEKAGIIKPGVPVVIGRRQPEVQHVFETVAAKNNSPLVVASDRYQLIGAHPQSNNGQLVQRLQYQTPEKELTVDCDLLGSYQQDNLATVLQTLETLNAAGRFVVSEDSIRNALWQVGRLTGLKGRWHQLGKRPRVFCDTGHNRDGITLVMQQLQAIPHQQLHMVFGMVDDKDVDSVLALLPPSARYYFCKPDVPRGLDAAILAAKAKAIGLNGITYPSVNEALREARTNATSKDVVFVGGSTFVVAEVV